MVQMVRTGALTIALATVLASPALAQVIPGSQQGLGLTGADIPPILKAVQADPYRYPAAPACESIPQEIVALNQVLGPDVDGERVKTSKVHMAMNYARGMIPYRGYVRFLTRADSKDKALQAAATAGYARRGFLRGLEAHLQCAPSADTQVADVSDKVPDIKVAEAEPPQPPRTPSGEDVVRVARTPVSSVKATPPPADTRAVDEPRPVSARVVYRWVDTVSGQAAVPDGR